MARVTNKRQLERMATILRVTDHMTEDELIRLCMYATEEEFNAAVERLRNE